MTNTDKITNFEEAYKFIQEMKETYKDCEDEAKLEEGRKTIREMIDELVEHDNVNLEVWRDYEDALNKGNDYLDINHNIRDEHVKPFVDCMQKQGLTHFTMSSTWSSMVELAWLFQQEGCEVVGMAEVVDITNTFTNETESKPAFLFKVNQPAQRKESESGFYKEDWDYSTAKFMECLQSKDYRTAKSELGECVCMAHSDLFKEEEGFEMGAKLGKFTDEFEKCWREIKSGECGDQQESVIALSLKQKFNDIINRTLHFCY
jgi:hypothetical protein